MIKIKLFARLRDLCGKSELDLPYNETLAGVLEQVKGRLPELSEWIERGKVLISVNQEMADPQVPIRDGDEIGLMPPFSGGAIPWGEVKSVGLQAESFDLDAEVRQIKAVSGRIGAVVSFVGTVRDFSEGREILALHFEHHPKLTEKYLRELREEALKKFNLIEVRMIHRIGTLAAGEDIVAVVAASEHRAEAFEACKWCVDELKRSVPLWKKEVTPEEETWVPELV